MSKSINQIRIEMQKGMKLIMEMDKLFERWKKIDGYDNYSVSTFGRVRNDDTNKILKNLTDRDGYHYITLCNKKNGQKKNKVHRLVANAFIKNSQNKKCVDHKDNNRLNNNLTNLRWATVSENSMNVNKRSNNTSGVTGVYFSKRSLNWYAQISINKNTISIGYYNTLEEAIYARIKKANEIFGDFTHSSQKQ